MGAQHEIGPVGWKWYYVFSVFKSRCDFSPVVNCDLSQGERAPY
jgi:hypothetical protein